MKFIEAPFIKKVAPASAKVDARFLPGGVEETYNDYRGRSFRELWLKFADGTNWDVLSLGFMTDVVKLPRPTSRLRC